MAEVITTAGRAPQEPQPEPESPRKAAVRAIRTALRNPQATDADVEDALEALIELSKD